MLVMGIALLAASAVGAFVLGLRPGRPAAATMAERLDILRGEQAPKPAAPVQVLRGQEGGRLRAFNLFFGQTRGAVGIAVSLERAAIPLRVGEFYLIRFGLAFLLFVAPLLFSPGIMGFIFGIGLAVVGYQLPPIYVSLKRKSRLAKIDKQLGEVLTMVSNSLKTGYGLMQGLDFAARQIQPPLSLELIRTLRDTSLGMAAEDAVNALGDRIPTTDMDMVVSAINIQRSVGGNLAETLDSVAFTMRERERIRGEIATLTAQQKMTGIIIAFLPLGVGLLFYVINPDYIMVLFTEQVGRIMLAVAVALEAIGIMVMRRMTAIEV